MRKSGQDEYKPDSKAFAILSELNLHILKRNILSLRTPVANTLN